jgi:hypothetical protein
MQEKSNGAANMSMGLSSILQADDQGGARDRTCPGLQV